MMSIVVQLSAAAVVAVDVGLYVTPRLGSLLILLIL